MQKFMNEAIPRPFRLYNRIKFLNKPSRTEFKEKEAMILNHTWKTYLAGIGKNCADIKFDALLMKIY